MCREDPWPDWSSACPTSVRAAGSEVVDQLAAAVATTPDVYLLDRTSDADHNRSVLTFAGPPVPVMEAMEAAVDVALRRIDMTVHEGQHPRIGAVDVVPFVPLGDSTIDECVELARRFGARVAERFDLPVYLYARAATRPDRVVLADLRRPQFEGLRETIGQHGREPDFGPPRLHPTGGAVAVGARPFLIAYNINLASPDVDLARAHRAACPRKLGRPATRAGPGPAAGGAGLCPGLDEPAGLQRDLALAGLGDGPGPRRGRGRRAARVRAHRPGAPGGAARRGGSPRRAADRPVEARLRAAAEWLRIRDFRPDMALELRLAAAMGGAAA